LRAGDWHYAGYPGGDRPKNTATARKEASNSPRNTFLQLAVVLLGFEMNMASILQRQTIDLGNFHHVQRGVSYRFYARPCAGG
jgi:hypothetical protein